MYGPKSMVIRMEYYRYLQEQALKRGTDPLKELDRVFERAMAASRQEQEAEDEVSAQKRAAAERMAHARSFRRIEQHA